MSRLSCVVSGLVMLALAAPAIAADPPKGAPPAKPGAGHAFPSPEQVMKDLDKNKDGVLSEEEFLASPHLKNKEMGKEIFKRIDANHDGKITLQELKDAHAKMEARIKAFRAEHAGRSQGSGRWWSQGSLGRKGSHGRSWRSIPWQGSDGW